MRLLSPISQVLVAGGIIGAIDGLTVLAIGAPLIALLIEAFITYVLSRDVE